METSKASSEKRAKPKAPQPRHDRHVSTTSTSDALTPHMRTLSGEFSALRGVPLSGSANTSASAPTPSTRVSAITAPKNGEISEEGSTAASPSAPVADKSGKKSIRSWLSSSLKINAKQKLTRTSSTQKFSASDVNSEEMYKSSGGLSSLRDDKEKKDRSTFVAVVSSSEEEDSPRLDDPKNSKEPLTRHDEELALWREMSKLHPERKVDDVYYLLAVPWLRVWSTYWQKVDQGRKPHAVPGTIDNTCLFEDIENQTLRLGMSKRYDYRLVSEAQWAKLHGWYGGGPEVRRHVIPIGNSSLTKVEVYLLNLTVMTTTASGRVDPASARTFTVSRRLRVGDFRTLVCDTFEADPKFVRLWNFFAHASDHPLDDDDKTLGEEGIVHGQTIVAQTLRKGDKKGGLALPFLGKKSGTSEAKRSLDIVTGSASKRRHRGCCGLDSWGSAPVLNPVIQCMSNTVPLCEFFLNEEHVNLPGLRAVFASDDESDRLAHLGLQFATVLQDLWSVDTRSSPKARGISRIIAPNLRLRCPSRTPTAIDIVEVLLRSLHWDLNRIAAASEGSSLHHPTPSPHGTPKASSIPTLSSYRPSLNLASSNAPSASSLSSSHFDKQQAELAWSTALLGCQSVISDLFMGQVRESRICSSCHSIDVGYEVFTSLSLPVMKSFENKLFYEVPVLRLHDQNSAVKYGAYVSLGGRVSELKQALSSAASIPAERIQLVTINHQRSFNMLTNSMPVSHIPKKQLLIAYEMPENSEEYLQVRVIHRKYVSGSKNFDRQWKIYSVPFLVFVRPKASAQEVYEKVWHACKRFIATVEEVRSAGRLSSSSAVVDSEQPHYKARINHRCRVPFNTEQCLFRLSLVNDAADRCGLGNECRSATSPAPCSGCRLNIDEKVSSPLHLAIDWEHAFRKKHYHEDEALSVHVHKDVLAYRVSLKAPITLQECLKCYLSPQVVNNPDAWKCKDCDEARHQLSRKIIRLPEILVLHLDRKPPQVDENHPLYNTFRENLVEFPLKALNLSNMIEGNSSTKPLSYDLYGVINHDQEDPLAFASALCNNKNDKYWYLFKDRSVRRSYDLLKLQSKRTNILFYRRSSALPGAWMTLKQICESRIVNSILCPDNAVLLYQHACMAQAEDLKRQCVSVIADNLDVATRELPDDALFPTEAGELISQIAEADLEKRATYVTSKKEAVEEVCARCDRLERKKLHGCATCRRLVCKKCSIKSAGEEREVVCVACSRLLEFTQEKE